MTPPLLRLGEKIRDLLELAPDALVVVGPGGLLLEVNAQVEQLFGCGREVLLGRPAEVLLAERCRGAQPDRPSGYFADPRGGSMSEEMELFGLRPDGVEFPIEVRLRRLETEEGPLLSASFRDVARRKQAERALQDKIVELQKATRARDQFLTRMSHELRTPLNAVIGFTGTLLMKLPGPLTDDQEDQLKTIESSAGHLLSLINDLLDLAKIDSGKMELRPARVVCQGVVQEVAAALRPLAEAKGLRFNVHLPEADCVVKADRRALKQILLNLANNAVKFTDQGRIDVDLRQEVRDGRTLTEFAVRDTGVGVRPEDQARLFRAFEQVLGPARSRPQGTGMGLHLSQKLAGLLGGRIALFSEYGRGSTFTLYLVGN